MNRRADTLSALGYCLDQATQCLRLGYESAALEYLETAETHRQALIRSSHEGPARPSPEAPPDASPQISRKG